MSQTILERWGQIIYIYIYIYICVCVCVYIYIYIYVCVCVCVCVCAIPQYIFLSHYNLCPTETCSDIHLFQYLYKLRRFRCHISTSDLTDLNKSQL